MGEVISRLPLNEIITFNIPSMATTITSKLAALTNIAQNTTGYVYLPMDGFSYFALHCITSGATPTDTLTLTVEATWQDDGTAQASCSYIDVTNAWFGAASYVDTTVVLERTVPCTAKYVRLKYVTSAGGGNDADLTVFGRTQRI